MTAMENIDSAIDGFAALKDTQQQHQQTLSFGLF